MGSMTVRKDTKSPTGLGEDLSYYMVCQVVHLHQDEADLLPKDKSNARSSITCMEGQTAFKGFSWGIGFVLGVPHTECH